MKNRAAIWATAGFLIAGFWALALYPVRMVPLTAEPVLWLLARLSCPVVFAGSYFNVGLKFYWVMLANAATYGLVGMMVERLRRPLHLAR